MGKASFATLQDGSLGDTGGRIQLYVTRDAVGEEVYADFKRWIWARHRGRGGPAP